MSTFWLFCLLVGLATKADHLWKEVLVPKFMIDGLPSFPTGYMINLSSVEPKLTCGTSCDRLTWCNTFCYNISTGECIKSNALISILYVSNSSNTYTCHTHLEPDFVVGAKISSSTVLNGREPINLVQGIYNFVNEMTCCGAGGIDPWIMIDLLSPKVIREIKITTQLYNYDPDLPVNTDVKVGAITPVGLGNFSNFELFGTFPSTIVPQQTYSFKKNIHMRVQYISIQKYTNGGFGSMVICQVMALGT